LARPLSVVLGHERIEARLLLEDVGGGRFRGFLLEREVHPLVSAVLRRMSGFGALEVNAESQPPHGGILCYLSLIYDNRRLVDQNSASWNPIALWLRTVVALQRRA
jgi:hypothetical protein